MAARLANLQLRYNDEYEAGLREFEAYQRSLEMKRAKEDFQQAMRTTSALEQQALERDAKTHAIVLQIEQNVAPAHLVVRTISELACCALLRALRSNTNVLSLDLSNNALSDFVGDSVAKMLLRNRKLRALNLAYNGLTIRSLEPIGRALQSNSVLTSLTLESNPILLVVKNSNSSSSNGSEQTNAAPATLPFELFMTAIATNSSLTALNLFNTQMTHEVGRALSQAFVKNAAIISLEVSGNTLKQSDLAVISSHAAKNQARLATARQKTAQISQDLAIAAEQLALERKAEAKKQADLEWHEANAKQRAETRECEEWERARLAAEAEVQHLLDMEAQNKEYLVKRELEKKPKAKGKK